MYYIRGTFALGHKMSFAFIMLFEIITANQIV